MTSQRENWSKRLRDIMDGRPVRWAEARNLIGDYDGRERTLEVFNADAKDQRQLLRRLRPVREDLERAAGGPTIIIFHTSAEGVYRQTPKSPRRSPPGFLRRHPIHSFQPCRGTIPPTQLHRLLHRLLRRVSPPSAYRPLKRTNGARRRQRRTATSSRARALGSSSRRTASTASSDRYLGGYLGRDRRLASRRYGGAVVALVLE